MLQYSNVPFISVLIATFLPTIISITGFNYIQYFPLIFILVFVIINFRYFLNIKIEVSHYIFLILSLPAIIYPLMTGRGIGSGGILIIMFLVFFYYYTLKNSINNTSVFKLISQISIIYFIHLIFLYIEFFLIVFGNQNFLIENMKNSSIEIYKGYNHAYFLHFIGFDYARGLNSLLLGSQAAAQLTILMFFWWLPIYKYDPFKKNLFILLLIIIMIPISSQMTSMILLAGALIYSIYLMPYSLLGNNFLKISLLALILIFPFYFYNIIFFKLTDPTEMPKYYDRFLEPVLFFIDQNLADKIWGYGSNRFWEYADNNTGPASDFGYFAIVLQSGAYFVGLLTFVISYLCFKYTYLIKNKTNTDINQNYLRIWITLGSMNCISVLIWLGSLIHYVPALELAGRELFSLHIAVLMISIYKIIETNFYKS